MESETNKEKDMIKTHRVGSITLGLALVLFGSLFLLHLFVPMLDYRLIFHLWPCIFILLGIEVLLGVRKESREFAYDKGAIVLLIILALFAMGMGIADFCIEQYEMYAVRYW